MAKVSATCRRMIQNFEGLRLRAYRDTGGVLTIGYGHTGRDVRPGMVITRAKAEDLFCQDLKRFEGRVQNMLTRPLNQNQFDALVSLCYNIGPSALRKSALMRLVNEGKLEVAAKQFDRWTRDNGRKLAALVKRRAIEKEMFLKGI